MTVVAEQTFAPPGPGTWFLDPDPLHAGRRLASTPSSSPEFIRGFGEGLLRYGRLLEYLDWAFVNGFPYYSPRPVGAPPEAVGHPPKEVWDELRERHPEIRRRLETSATVFERKLWREDLERWDREMKPAAFANIWRCSRSSRARCRPTSCSRTSTGAARTRSAAATSTISSTCPALLPIGDFLVHAQEWTGRLAGRAARAAAGNDPRPARGRRTSSSGSPRRCTKIARPRSCSSRRRSRRRSLAELRGLPGETGAARGRLRRLGSATAR